MPEVSTESGGHGDSVPDFARVGGVAGADGGGAKPLGARLRDDGVDLGVHEGFLSMNSNVVSG
jgi:hypothetical protein